MMRSLIKYYNRYQNLYKLFPFKMKSTLLGAAYLLICISTHISSVSATSAPKKKVYCSFGNITYFADKTCSKKDDKEVEHKKTVAKEILQWRMDAVKYKKCVLMKGANGSPALDSKGKKQYKKVKCNTEGYHSAVYKDESCSSLHHLDL